MSYVTTPGIEGSEYERVQCELVKTGVELLHPLRQ